MQQSPLVGRWAHKLPKQNLRFLTEWEEIRNSENTCSLFSLSLTTQPVTPALGPDCLLSPGHSPQNLGKGGTTN